MIGMMGLGAAAFAAVEGEALAGHELDERCREHLATIGKCALICNEAAHHCLTQLCEGHGDREQHAKAHEATNDCQAFCVLTAAMMARSSPMAQYAHQACAEACRCCAEACEKSSGQQKIMQDCAKQCRDCERVCREMARDMDHKGSKNG